MLEIKNKSKRTLLTRPARPGAAGLTCVLLHALFDAIQEFLCIFHVFLFLFLFAFFLSFSSVLWCHDRLLHATGMFQSDDALCSFATH